MDITFIPYVGETNLQIALLAHPCCHSMQEATKLPKEAMRSSLVKRTANSPCKAALIPFKSSRPSLMGGNMEIELLAKQQITARPVPPAGINGGETRANSILETKE